MMSIPRSWKKLALAIVLTALVAVGSTAAFRGRSDVPYKVYVILGMHANFYHSWRGDTNDEAGFGTDIRVVREIIRMLDEANAKGQDARAYWEGESLFTFEDIIPNHAPDIIDGIRRRIDAGLDEFMPAPYSNTLFSATTPDEMAATVKWSITNPWGSGALDLFGSYVPLIRPQEGMATAGMNQILLDNGIQGVVLAYSTYSFTTFSNFVPVLPVEERYGLTRMRMQDADPPITLFPCVSAADVVNYISMEKWLLELRKLQTSGKVKQDLVIHINFDADAETWLPMLPPPLSGVPNAGGLPEYIKDVNKYDWARFTVPGEYMKDHPPAGEVMIRQDTADGGWDGNYSWAEKYPSHLIWSALERSRLYAEQAEALLGGASKQVRDQANALLYEGRDSSFFHRVRGLSTTHFGMSTPMVNEERQAVAEKVVGAARDQADKARRLAAKEALNQTDVRLGAETVYAFQVQDLRAEGEKVLSLVRVPVILPSAEAPLELKDKSGQKVPFSLIDIETLPDGQTAATILLAVTLAPGESPVYRLDTFRAVTMPPEGLKAAALMPYSLDNGRLQLELETAHGVKSLTLDGYQIGGADFLSHFITYATDKEPVTYRASSYQFEDLAPERWAGVTRARLTTNVPIQTPHGEARAKIDVTFTLPDDAPWLAADVTVAYPYTVKEDVIHSMQQKLRRYLDLRWIEVAPFQIHPRLDATRQDPIRVWKHNWLGVTSYYDMNYGQINPKNAEWDSMNHQVTAGWVAVSDKKQGLLVGLDAEAMTSYAFATMRLKEDQGAQRLWINPLGTYNGKQADYSQLGGNGVGSAIGDAASAALRPNGPSFNGQTESFSLILAPYAGDRPPADLEAQAHAFFHPPAVVYLATPPGVEALFKEDVENQIGSIKLEAARKAEGPLAAPLAFLVNPTEQAVDVVWDQPVDPRVEGFQVECMAQGGDWTRADVGLANRLRVDNLTNGGVYVFRMRSVGMGRESEWTAPFEVVIGPVENAGIMGAAANISASLVGKFIYYSFVHLFTTP